MSFATLDKIVILPTANGLNSKRDLGSIKPLNGNSPETTEEFERNNLDLAVTKTVNGRIASSIIEEPPNLYKQNGVPMSKIPYFFETPVPKYFRDTGWFKSEHMWKYVTWAFSKCQNIPHKIVIEGKEIILAPYEFISGRLSSPKECFLTENIFRNQQKILLNAGFLKKSTNSKTNHYTCYIWVTEHFCKSDNQQNNQPLTNHQPTVNHKSYDKKNIYKEDHPSIPSFEKKGRDGLNDDLFSKEENKIHIFTGQYITTKKECQIYLTPEELENCIKTHGSKEKIISIIQQVLNWPGRLYEIKDWPKTISNWKYKNTAADRIVQNEEIGKKAEKFYHGSEGWSLRVYKDNLKDERGLLFELQEGATAKQFFIRFSDPNFQEKLKETIINIKLKPKKVK